MSKRATLRKFLTSGSLAVSTFIKCNSPLLVEALGTTSIDFIVIDRQHSAFDIESIEQLVRAADVYDLPVIVRLAHSRSVAINNVLDAGASGLMIPQVEGKETIKRAAKQARYADGRSLSMGTRAADFGKQNKTEFIESNDLNSCIVPMIESENALDSVTEIAAMQEVQALMIGETDLAFSLGEPVGSDRLHEAITRVTDAAQAHDCGVGIYTSSMDDIDEYEAMTYVVCGSDLSMMSSAYDTLLQSE